jgi:ABC-2 type transport system ATP-binding protein
LSIIRLGRIMETGTLTELRHLTRTQILLETKESAEMLTGLEGVYDLKQTDSTYSFQIDSERIGSLITGLGSYGVTRFESTPPNLEDLFMRHYTDQKADGPVDPAPEETVPEEVAVVAEDSGVDSDAKQDVIQEKTNADPHFSEVILDSDAESTDPDKVIPAVLTDPKDPEDPDGGAS